MERDFMGLNSKEGSIKREITDEGPEVQWPFMKNSSSHPNFMSFRNGASQGDGMNKMNPPLPLSSPLPKSSFTTYGQNLTGASMGQQFLGIPMTVTSSAGPVVGFTDPWNSKKPAAAPAQMTIFYAGSVSVFEGISPEKAQAIMLLAGNGTPITSNMIPARSPVSSPVTPVSKVSPTMANAVVSNQPLSSQPSPGLTNHLSLSSHPTAQSGSVPVGNDEQVVNRTTGMPSAPVSRPEPQRAVPSRGPIPVSGMTPSAVPQFRKASLARFLEKRKERVVTVAPYPCDKKPHDTPGNNNLGPASTSAANTMTSR